MPHFSESILLQYLELSGPSPIFRGQLGNGGGRDRLHSRCPPDGIARGANR